MYEHLIRLVPVIVDVTEDDISKGDPRDCKECPVALAILRAGGEEMRHWFFTQNIQDERRDVWMWINHFDTWACGDPIRSRPSPVKFTLFVPENKIEQPF